MSLPTISVPEPSFAGCAGLEELEELDGCEDADELEDADGLFAPEAGALEVGALEVEVVDVELTGGLEAGFDVELLQVDAVATTATSITVARTARVFTTALLAFEAIRAH